jgi:hypothetical protein
MSNKHQSQVLFASFLAPTLPMWTGPLLINAMEQLCQVTLCVDVFEAKKSSALMADIHDVPFLDLQFYPLSILIDSIMHATEPAQILMTVDGEKSPLDRFAAFLSSKDLVRMLPPYL